MPKLEKKQIIILVALVVAILYGAYEFLLVRPAKKIAVDPGVATSQLKTFVSDMMTDISKDAPGDLDIYLVSRAEAEWTKDPFFEQKAFREWAKLRESEAKARAATASGTAKAITFIYTGYLESARKTIAIINGIEYAAGESLQEEGYVLKGISPIKVTIGKKADGTTFDVLIQE